MTLAVDPPWPIEDADSAEFWAGARRGELRLQLCTQCARYQYYPRAICTHCSSDELEWATAAGTGTLYSYTVPRRAPHPAFESWVPYVVALVDLDEGPRMLSHLVDADPDDVLIGARVQVTFRQVSEAVVLPMFTYETSSAAPARQQSDLEIT